MEFHFEQLTRDPMNQYAAFDFSVAAAHLPEWLGAFHCSKQLRGAEAEALNAVCKELANGAKHFFTDPKLHDAVRATGVSTPAISGLTRSGITISGATRKQLLILLATDEEAALGVSDLGAEPREVHNQLGWEMHIDSGDLLTQVCRSDREIEDVSAAWRAAFIQKGWR